jgi:hypothetical protein
MARVCLDWGWHLLPPQAQQKILQDPVAQHGVPWVRSRHAWVLPTLQQKARAEGRAAATRRKAETNFILYSVGEAFTKT